MTPPILIKCHGVGNDFLIWFDPARPGGALPFRDDGDDARGGASDRAGELDDDLVRALCDRRTGVGADGVVVARPPIDARAAVAMELRNADGSRAETSGNGLRCLALALVRAGVAGSEVALETGSGLRRCVVGPPGPGGSSTVSVEMGRLLLGPELGGTGPGRPQPASGAGPRWTEPRPDPVMAPGAPGPPAASPLLAGLLAHGFRARLVDAGNPHLVLLGESLAGVDISAVGPELEATVPDGANVELAATTGSGSLDLLVWERGAGRTDACGSGSCATAAVARAAGLVADRVEVRNPGGELLVELSGPLGSPEAVLSGPAVQVARIEVDLTAFAPHLAAARPSPEPARP